MHNPSIGRPEPLVLSDLDGTLIRSRRRCGDVTDALVVERYKGRDVGFMSETAWGMLNSLQQRSTFVPATARTIRQYSRIEFPVRPALALVAGGGVILVDGSPDPVWSAATSAMVDNSGATVDQVVTRMADLPIAEEPRNGDGRFACVKVSSGADTTDFTQWCEVRGWRVVRQDGRVYALPAPISKGAAVARVAEIVGSGPRVVMGDGLTDVEMMELGKHAITPEDGAIWTSGIRRATVVEGGGLRAAEAVLEATLQCLESPKTASNS